MFHILRRIRQNLLQSNHFRTYFLYAIGEILLVVIGILIALQINNWNEKRIEIKQEVELLMDFKNSLELDLKNEIQPLISRLQNDTFRIQTLLNSTQKAQITQDPNIKGPRNGVPVLTHEVAFNPQVTTYKTLESHGVSLIRDKNLRNKILVLYNRDYKRIQDDIDNKNINIRDYGRPLMRAKFKELTTEYGFEIMDLNIYDDPVFWNYLLTAKRNNRIMVEMLREVETTIGQTISEIQSYLN